MRWYLNDVSLQGQFASGEEFLTVLRQLLKVRQTHERLRTGLRTSRGLPERPVSPALTMRAAVLQDRDRTLRQLSLAWLDATGPFTEDDRIAEADDYFECLSLDVTDSGLGEAARRVKNGDQAMTFSFPGGTRDFAHTPLSITHGLPEEPLGTYKVENVWEPVALAASVAAALPSVTSWRTLVEVARERFPRLVIPDAVYLNRALASEAFSSVIAESVLRLLSYLDAYMAGREPIDGSEGPGAREIVDKHFTGDRAVFTGESSSNKRGFDEGLTFPDPERPGMYIFAPWHGKISHRFFRLHFEWPVPGKQGTLRVLYLGPKITKS